MNKSLWLDTISLPSFPPLTTNEQKEVVIVGGGISGILLAYVLKQNNIDYLLIEANTICSATTGYTTAKITSQHGLIYHSIIDKYGVKFAQLYLEANEKAIREYQQMCSNIDCDYQVVDNYIYSDNNHLLEKEMIALEAIGYPYQYLDKIALPVDHVKAIGFTNQGQFNPLKFIKGIVKDLNIHEHTKAIDFGDDYVKTENNIIKAKHIVVATHFPIINRYGMYFMKLYQSRSYVLATKNIKVVNDMYKGAAANGLSFRDYDDYLLIGGGSHRSGKDGGKYQVLHNFMENHYPQGKISYQWSNQDCMTLDNIPYIGKYCSSKNNLYVITGFNKWGMTSAMVSAYLIADLILGRDNKYQELFSPQRSMKHRQLLSNIFESSINLINPLKPRCPHMFCHLKWNKEEHCWDCSCHGSRFDKDGNILNNPANNNMKIR